MYTFFKGFLVLTFGRLLLCGYLQYWLHNHNKQLSLTDMLSAFTLVESRVALNPINQNYCYCYVYGHKALKSSNYLVLNQNRRGMVVQE